jgi:hypothetical protein
MIFSFLAGSFFKLPSFSKLTNIFAGLEKLWSENLRAGKYKLFFEKSF